VETEQQQGKKLKKLDSLVP